MPAGSRDPMTRHVGVLIVGLCLAFATVIFLPQHAHWLLVIIGTALFLRGAYPLMQRLRLRHWQEGSAELLELEEQIVAVAEARGQTSQFRFPCARYRYIVDGSRHENDRVAFNERDAWVVEMNAWGDPTPAQSFWWRRLQPGDSIQVFFDPDHPGQAVLTKAMSPRLRSHCLATLLAGLLLIVFWLFVA